MARRKTGYIQDRGTSFRIAYYNADGLRQFETFKTREDAERELAQRLAEIAKGLPVSSKPNAVLSPLWMDLVPTLSETAEGLP